MSKIIRAIVCNGLVQNGTDKVEIKMVRTKWRLKWYGQSGDKNGTDKVEIKMVWTICHVIRLKSLSEGENGQTKLF